MTTPRAARVAATILVVTAGLAIGWFALAPDWLGGRTTYVVTKGTSMEPRFKAGDLAVVREAGEYRVGQVVAYRSRTLGVLVLHRVVGREGSRYVLKGDNNDFVDPELPEEQQLVGALTLRVPAIGRYAERVRDPVPVGVLAGLSALCLLGGAGVATRRRRRRRTAAAPLAVARASRRPIVAARGTAQVAAAGLSVSCLVALAGYLHTPERAVDSTVPYTQTGTIGYTAQAARGPVYPDGVASTGETLFLELLRSARFELDYRFAAEVPHEVEGTAALHARVVSASGWSRTIVLAPATPFSGDHVAVAGAVRLDAIRRLLERVERATGITNTTYRLELIPRVRVTGSLAGTTLSTGFAPVVPFALDHLHLEPPPDPLSADGKPAERALGPTISSAVTTTQLRPRKLSLGSAELDVGTARRVGMAGVVVSLLALATSAIVLRRRGGDEATRIADRYSGLIASAVRSDDRVVEFDSIEALARLAERYDRLIVHERREHGDAYWFAEEGLYYLYLAHDAAAPPVLYADVEVPRLRRVV